VAVQLRGADLILHAGDVCTASVLAELAEYAPVVAVLGNNDEPDVVRMRRRFPAAELVVFGHSHIPVDESAPGLRIFNPGSPSDRRRQPHGTLGVLEIDSGRLTGASIVPVT
jgi:predicted phosphodiesterase